MSTQTKDDPIELLKAVSAELESVKKELAEVKSAAMDDGDGDNPSKNKLYKNRKADTNDPDDENTAGDNDYDDDDVNDTVDDHAPAGQTKPKKSPKQNKSKTVAAELRAEIAELKATMAMKDKAPIIDSILQSKTDLGTVTESSRQAEYDKLAKLPVDELKAVQAEFTTIANARKENTPFVRYHSASLNRGSGQKESADSFIQEAILGV